MFTRLRQPVPTPAAIRRRPCAVGARRRLAALAPLLLLACQRRDPVDPRTLVELPSAERWALATHPALAVDGATLRELTRQALEGTGRFSAPGPAARGPGGALAAHASASIVEVGGGADAGAASQARVRVRLEYRPALADEGGRLVLEAEGAAAGPDAAAAATGAALQRAVERLLARLDIASHTDEQLLADLRSADPERAQAALEQLSARRSPAALAPLLETLRSPEPEAATRALSALVLMDDARAVRPIILAAEQRDFAFFLQALYGLGALGGEEAEAYLFTVERGHADARARAAASEALTQARLRAAGPARAGEDR